MSLYGYLNRIRFIDMLISQQRTGTPGELADKLGISERWLFYFLDELKNELGSPIRYDRRKRSYVYEKPGKIVIAFTRDLDKRQLSGISGGVSLIKFSHCIYNCSSRSHLTGSQHSLLAVMETSILNHRTNERKNQFPGTNAVIG